MSGLSLHHHQSISLSKGGFQLCVKRVRRKQCASQYAPLSFVVLGGFELDEIYVNELVILDKTRKEFRVSIKLFYGLHLSASPIEKFKSPPMIRLAFSMHNFIDNESQKGNLFWWGS